MGRISGYSLHSIDRETNPNVNIYIPEHVEMKETISEVRGSYCVQVVDSVGDWLLYEITNDDGELIDWRYLTGDPVEVIERIFEQLLGE